MFIEYLMYFSSQYNIIIINITGWHVLSLSGIICIVFALCEIKSVGIVVENGIAKLKSSTNKKMLPSLIPYKL